MQIQVNAAKPSDSLASKNVEPSQKPKWTVAICEKIINFSLIMIFLGLPLFFTSFSFQGLAFEKQIYFYFWLFLALVAWALKGVAVGELKIRKTPLDIPIALFLIFYIVSTALSIDKWHSLWGLFGDPSRGLANVIALAVAYYLVFSNFSRIKIHTILGALIVSNLVLSLWTLAVVMKIDVLPSVVYKYVPAALTGSFSGLAMFLALMVPLLIVAVFKIVQSKADKIWKVPGLFFVLATLVLDLFLLLALYSFVSWIGWTALLLGVIVFLIYTLSAIVKIEAVKWTWLPMATFVVLMVFVIIGPLKIARVQLPLEVGLNYKFSGEVVKGALKDNFFLGTGPATYGYNFSLYKPQDFNLNPLYNLRFYQGSGAFFEALPTLGAAGGFLLAILILSYLSVSLYLLTREKAKDKLYSLGLFSALAVFLAEMLLARMDGPVLILGALLGAVALAMLLKESGSEESYLNLSLKASPKYALAFAFVFMVISASVVFLLVFMGKMYAADIYVGLANKEKEVNEKTVNYVATAISLYGKESRYYLQSAQMYMILANNEILKGGPNPDVSKVQDYFNRSVKIAREAKNMSAKDAATVESLAQIYETARFYVPDSFRLAEEEYGNAQKLEPRNPIYYLKIGQLKVGEIATKKDPEEKKALVAEAKELFQKSAEEKKNFDPGYYNLSMANEALGDLDGAIDSMAEAAKYDNGNINYVFNLGRLYQLRNKDNDLLMAEAWLKRGLEINEKEPSLHLYLGYLYEKKKEKDKALAEYQRALDLLPAENTDGRNKVGQFIENLKNGVDNSLEKLNSPSQPQE